MNSEVQAQNKEEMQAKIFFENGIMGFPGKYSFVFTPIEEIENFPFWGMLEAKGELTFTLLPVKFLIEKNFIVLEDMEKLTDKAGIDTEQSTAFAVIKASIEDVNEDEKLQGILEKLTIYANLQAPIIIDTNNMTGKQENFDGEKYSLETHIVTFEIRD